MDSSVGGEKSPFLMNTTADKPLIEQMYTTADLQKQMENDTIREY